MGAEAGEQEIKGLFRRTIVVCAGFNPGISYEARQEALGALRHDWIASSDKYYLARSIASRAALGSLKPGREMRSRRRCQSSTDSLSGTMQALAACIARICARHTLAKDQVPLAPSWTSSSMRSRAASYDPAITRAGPRQTQTHTAKSTILVGRMMMHRRH